MPNWLREEIKKAVITNSSVDHPKEETESREDEVADKTFGNRDQADSKSISSARSTEEDDDDEVFSFPPLNILILHMLTFIFVGEG